MWIVSDSNTSTLQLNYCPNVLSSHNITVNQPTEILIQGENFTPESQLIIENTTVQNVAVLSTTTIRATVISGVVGSHQIVVNNGDTSSNVWGNDAHLNVEHPLVSTNGWVDFRQGFSGIVQTTLNQTPTTDLASAGLTTNSTNGLTTTSTASALSVAFLDWTIPYSGRFIFECINSLVSTVQWAWAGLTYPVINWSNPRRSILAATGMENRTFVRFFYGKNSFYHRLDNIPNSGWTNNIIHTIIEVDKREIRATQYGHTSLSYDWNNGSSGTKIADQYYVIDDLMNNGYHPYCYFHNASSNNHLTAFRIR